MDRLGKLFVVATPIGNLKDITLRAIETLRSVDFIACEDTRRTRKLLSHLDIRGKRLISYYEQRERVSSRGIVKLLLEGNDVALVSDAGTPCISDPGYAVVRAAREEGIDVIPVPGASAVIAALSASGFPTDRFLFVGFLPRKGEKLKAELGRIAASGTTTVAYESPHRIERTLKLIATEFPSMEIGVYREITKINEEFVRGRADEVLAGLEGRFRGEFVIIFAPMEEERGETDIAGILRDLKEEGLSLKEAVRRACRITGLRRNEVYREALEIFGTEG